ncbi:MAG: hypothetical protein MJ202_08955 [Lentisphaeria bacterium]|nr:hypothetical protein [Lentisphaeria bacterium]
MQAGNIVFILVSAGLFLLVVGMAGMVLSDRIRKRRLERFLDNAELTVEWREHVSLMRPWREFLTGAMISLSVPVFVHFCLVGQASQTVAVLVGYLSAALCAMGCFSRQQKDLDELGAPMEARAVRNALISFSAFLGICLWGILTLAIAAVCLFVSITSN